MPLPSLSVSVEMLCLVQQVLHDMGLFRESRTPRTGSRQSLPPKGRLALAPEAQVPQQESLNRTKFSATVGNMKTQAVQKANNERLRRNEEKWSPALMDAGWTVLPSIILEKQHALGLDAVDVNILLQLARYWWFSDRPPFPSKATIAECMKLDPSTVRKHIARMDAMGSSDASTASTPKRADKRQMPTTSPD